jgi:glycosyltransferase involved in cell wall biosynthesis
LVICGNNECLNLLYTEKKYKGTGIVLPQIGLDINVFKNANYELSAQIKSANELIIGFIGRLVEEKGVLILLDALSRLMNCRWKLLIIGAGPLESFIKDKWAPIFRDRLIFIGSVDTHRVPGYIKMLDILVLPSITTKYWKEQFGLVLAEAMISGVPCIGSSSGAIPEVIGPGGLIFEEGNASDLSEKLHLMICDEALRNIYSVEAKRYAYENYSANAVGAKYINAFEMINKL